MQNYYKSEAEYYQKRYEETQAEIAQLHFQLGWLKGSLKRFKKLVESGNVTASKFYQSDLEYITDAYQKSIDEAKAYSSKTVVAEES